MGLNEDDVAEVRRWHTDDGHAHASALRWLRTCGFAKHDGVSASLHEPPAIGGDDILFTGGCVGRVDGRDMTREEVQTARKILRQMAGDARDAICGLSAIVIVDGNAG